MPKQIKYVYEDPRIYDGYCATIYTDGTFELRDHWAVNRLTLEQKAVLSSTIREMIDKDKLQDGLHL